MTQHMSIRLAWHMDGWNGKICSNPSANGYCSGNHSYPGMLIREKRNIECLEWEKESAGRSCADINRIPPCCYSINAFGSDTIKAQADPPSWFPGDPEGVEWAMPPATVCTWPYEEMYDATVKDADDKYDYNARLDNVKNYFNQFTEDRSLIFYYANYSNPLGEGEQNRYVLVGISRLKQIESNILYYDNCNDYVKKRYAGGFVWQKPVSSYYPEQGLRLPYHRYLDRPDILEQIAVIPENSRNFKYATRAFSDDDALVIVEQVLESVAKLESMGDTSENWSIRRVWLEGLISELWQGRGLYPGLPAVLDYLGVQDAIPWVKGKTDIGEEAQAKETVFSWFVNGRQASDLRVSPDQQTQGTRKWRLLAGNVQRLLQDILPRFSIEKEQIAQIVSEGRANNGLYASIDDIFDNPYILAEEYTGNDPDDHISFSRIDNGMYPSPELGGNTPYENDDWRRLRGLAVEKLRNESCHSFQQLDVLVHNVNHRLAQLPEWKRIQFNPNHFKLDVEEHEKALTFREHEGNIYVYLKHVFDAEQTISSQLRFLAGGDNITLRSPVTDGHWKSFLFVPESEISRKAPTIYDNIIASQSETCQKIFPRHLSVLSGAAGTGKTTVVKAIISAIRKAHGNADTFQLLAPTGKAADRLRDKTGEKNAATIHSFLAQHGWLNDNMTFKREGGKQEKNIRTYIIDESSMLDLELTVTLFRAIDWTTVQRLILVGDPNQLPPIGRGRFFADVIDWLQKEQPEAIGILKENIRQLTNRIEGRGTGILDLASLYVQQNPSADDNEDQKCHGESFLRKLHEQGEVDKDLRILYWKDQEELEQVLLDTMISDIEGDTGLKLDDDKPYILWNTIFGNLQTPTTPESCQVISPYRGEPFGVESLNLLIQNAARGGNIERFGQVSGFTLGDKVIQYRNRPVSNPLKGYNFNTRRIENVAIYNGELGIIKPHGYDHDKWSAQSFRLKRFSVSFSRKPNININYGRDLGRDCPNEGPEDNLELAYAISVHKAQGSEFNRIYFIVPKHKLSLLSRELFYTGITRAETHCTLLVEEDILPLLSMRRPEKSQLLNINSSLFRFRPIPDALVNMTEWYEEGKIHHTLTEYLVRSKSEVIIANLLFERGIEFRYEKPLFASDGTFYLPDFTIIWRGEEWYWEHVGNISESYRSHWEIKQAWYKKNFPERLITTQEGNDVTPQANAIIQSKFI